MMRRFAGALLLVAVLGGVSAAVAGVCTITDARVLVTNFGLGADLPSVAGLALPVEIDAASGTFRIDFAPFPTVPFSIVGVPSTVDIGAGELVGTIDATGNVAVAGARIDFVTSATAPPTPLGTVATLTTGASAVVVGGGDYVTHGSVVDFTTGALELAGQGVVPNAPLAGMPVVTGFSLACTLAPIPEPGALPKGLVLKRATGRGTSAKAPTDGSVVGDTLVVKAKLAAEGLDVAGRDLFLRLPGEIDVRPDGSTEDHSVLVHVPAGALMPRRGVLVASDTDGTTIRLVSGRRREGSAAAPLSGTVTVRQGKRGATIVLKQVGADLTRLVRGASTITVGVGDRSAARPATVVEKKKGVAITP